VGGGIQTAAHNAHDLADSEPQQNAGNDPGDAEVCDGGQDEQGNDESYSAGLFITVGILVGHGSNSLF
jgi:hypothetical protein